MAYRSLLGTDLSFTSHIAFFPFGSGFCFSFLFCGTAMLRNELALEDAKPKLESPRKLLMGAI